MPDVPFSEQDPFRVLIAGGGVAAVEAALALRDMGGEGIALTLLAPEPEFHYRPMSVGEPFSSVEARAYPLEKIARDTGAELLADSFESLDGEHQIVRTAAGEQLSYDALLLAPGARMHAYFDHVITIDDRHLDEHMHGLIQDVEGGYARRLAFIAPPGPMGWPLPLYELALMTADRAFDMNIELAVTIATPEETPLGVFGLEASAGIAALLHEHQIETIPSAHCAVPASGRIIISPGSRQLDVDRIVALPELSGPDLSGVPQNSTGGFIPIDRQCRVHGLQRVYAAGDATDFAVKQGGIAAQQADLAAQSIAALAGLAAEPPPFAPLLQGKLLTGDKARYLSARITGGSGVSSQITEAPAGVPPAKIAAKYLAPYLTGLDAVPAST